MEVLGIWLRCQFVVSFFWREAYLISFTSGKTDNKLTRQQNYDILAVHWTNLMLLSNSFENNLVYLFITPSQTGLNQKHSFSQ